MATPITPEEVHVGMTLVFHDRRGPSISKVAGLGKLIELATFNHWGTVTKITRKGTVTFKYGDAKKQFPPPYCDLYRPSAREIEVRHWKSTTPALDVVRLIPEFSHGDYGVTLDFFADKVPEGETVETYLDKAAADLKRFKDWYGSKPSGKAKVTP
jgi:hypothetical protein